MQKVSSTGYHRWSYHQIGWGFLLAGWWRSWPQARDANFTILKCL